VIRTSRDEDVRVVTMDRPDRRNALRPTDLDRLVEAVEDADAPVVSLRGAGDAFCAGADLDVVADLDDPEAFARHGQRATAALEAADPVVVAGVDGAARGGGVELALAADVRVATPDATFGEPGVTFGLFGAWGGTVRLPRVMGEGEAMDFALSGRVLDAAAAKEAGLVSRVVSDPHAVAEAVAGNAPDALGVLTERIRDRRARSKQEDAEATAFAELVAAHREDLREMAE